MLVGIFAQHLVESVYVSVIPIRWKSLILAGVSSSEWFHGAPPFRFVLRRAHPVSPKVYEPGGGKIWLFAPWNDGRLGRLGRTDVNRSRWTTK